jgi:transcriptional regulator with XRE-family HTH domain
VAFLAVDRLQLKASKNLPVVMKGTGLAAHLRHRREALGLTRKEAAKLIGVRGAAVGLWETGKHHPESEYWPGILQFIGYDPICPAPQTVPEKIAYLCRHKGISRRLLADLLGVDKATILKWEHGASQRHGSSKPGRLDALISAVRTGEPCPPELPLRTGPAEALYRARRGLHQTQEGVAGTLAVHTATYAAWEGGKGLPRPENWPAILRFVGYDPVCRHPKTFSDKIGAVRRRHGLTYRVLGALIGGSEQVILRLETNRTSPTQQIYAVIESLLRSPLPPSCDLAPNPADRRKSS